NREHSTSNSSRDEFEAEESRTVRRRQERCFVQGNSEFGKLLEYKQTKAFQGSSRMEKLRLIARLDIKNEYVIKGIHLEGLRKICDRIQLAKKYYDEGIDEIIFMDAVASLYGRNNLIHIIEKACEKVFVPITIGGGIRTLEDIGKALKAGA